MTPTLDQLEQTEREAREKGHEIAWITMGENLADGECRRCGCHLRLAVSREGLREVKGVAWTQSCLKVEPSS